MIRGEVKAVREGLAPDAVEWQRGAKDVLGVTVFGMRGHSQLQCETAAKSHVTSFLVARLDRLNMAGDRFREALWTA